MGSILLYFKINLINENALLITYLDEQTRPNPHIRVPFPSFFILSLSLSLFMRKIVSFDLFRGTLLSLEGI